MSEHTDSQLNPTSALPPYNAVSKSQFLDIVNAKRDTTDIIELSLDFDFDDYYKCFTYILNVTNRAPVGRRWREF